MEELKDNVEKMQNDMDEKRLVIETRLDEKDSPKSRPHTSPHSQPHKPAKFKSVRRVDL